MLPELPMMRCHVGRWTQHHDLPTLCSQHQTADCIVLHSRSCHYQLLMHPKLFPRFQSYLFMRIAKTGAVKLYAMMHTDTVCLVRGFECGLGGFAWLM